MTEHPTLRDRATAMRTPPQLSWDDDDGPEGLAAGGSALRQRSGVPGHNLDHGGVLWESPMAPLTTPSPAPQIQWITDPTAQPPAPPALPPATFVPTPAVALPPFARVAPLLPACPVPLASDEQLLRYHKPSFWSFPPTMIGLGVGTLLTLLLGIGAGGGGLLGGLVLTGVIALAVRSKLFRDAGCWVTSERLVLHDGTVTRLVPYAEIDAGSITFEGDSLALRTRSGLPLVLKGVPDAPLVADLLSRRQPLPAPMRQGGLP